MKCVVIGATGYAGGAIATELVARGHEVSGVARIPAELPAGVSAAPGSLHDLTFVERVISDADVVVLAVRATKISEDGPTLPEAMKAIIPLLRRQGALLAVVGGAGTLTRPGTQERVMDGDGFMPAWMPEAEAHAETLELLRSSDPLLDWFYLSPSAVFGAHIPGDHVGHYRLGGEELLTGPQGTSFISGADYADAFVDEIEKPTHTRQRFTVGY